MTGKKRPVRDKEVQPRREIVEVFKALRLDQPSEVRRLEELANLGEPAQEQSTYYMIEVTGTLQHDCALGV